jgi:hypothetical protein
VEVQTEVEKGQLIGGEVVLEIKPVQANIPAAGFSKQYPE